MKFEGTCIAVKDITKARLFYEEVFGLKVQQDNGINISFGYLALQQDFDWLTGIAKKDIIQKSNNMELYFEEDDLDTFVCSLKKRNDITYISEGIIEARWGQRHIRFYDLDYHIIEVGETLKITIQRFLDSGLTLQETCKRMDISLHDVQSILKTN